MTDAAARKPVISNDTAIDLDLEGFEVSTGTTADGVDYASFRHPGLHTVMGFGAIATALVLQRRAVGHAAQRGGVTKLVAVRTPEGLRDETGALLAA